MKTIAEETPETPHPASCILHPASTPPRSPDPRMYSDVEVQALARAFAFGFGALTTRAIEDAGFEVQHLLQLGWIKKTPGRWDAGWTYAGEFTNHYCAALKSL